MKLFIYLTIISLVSSMYLPSDAVVELTTGNFKEKVMESSELWLVEFYAPWCGHCKALAPEFKEAAKNLKGFVNLGAVDMTAHSDIPIPSTV